MNDFTNIDYKGLSNLLNSISPLEFGALGSLVGLLIAASLNSAEQNSIGNFLELVGQVILTVQAQMPTLSTPKTEFYAFEEEVREKLDYLLKTFSKRN